jgi:hypothetical protein
VETCVGPLKPISPATHQSRISLSGKLFNPHVTTGVATREYLDKMLAEPFESFTFSPAGALVYQLGQFGSAAKKIKGWNLN